MEIFYTLDLKDSSYSFSMSKDFPEVLDVYVGFRFEKSKNLKFNNLSYGIRLITKNNKIVFEKNYPKDGEKVISTDQEYLTADRTLPTEKVKLLLGEEYTLWVWAVESENFYKHSYNFIIGD